MTTATVVARPLSAGTTTTRRNPRATLPYLPGLDGLRVVSVLAVLIYHYRPDRSLLRGGFLGVEVFFVISGYLITSLLLTEVRTRKRVDLRNFWLRRIRRLWPALIAMMLVVGLVVAIFYSEDLGRLRGDIAFGFYAENWWHIVHGVSYVDIVADAGRRQPFQHLWSLAVEEQFYVVWPLVFTFGLWVVGQPRLRRITICLAILSWVAMVWFAWHGNQNHAYLGTESRSYGLLTGAILAFLYPPRRRRPARAGPRAGVVLDAAGFVALIGLGALFVSARQSDQWLYVFGFPLTDLLSAVLIIVIVNPAAGFGRMLGTPVLRWIGLRSYGIYLWGIAIFEFTRPGLDLNWSPLAILALRAVLVLTVVELSYRYIEMPVRRGSLGVAWDNFRAATGDRRRVLQRRWRTAAALLVVAATYVGATAVMAQPPDTLQLIGGHTQVGGGDCVLTDACRIPTPPTVATVTTQPGSASTSPQVTTATTAPAIQSNGWKVSAVGDSVLLGAATVVESTLAGPVGGGVLVNAAVSRPATTCIRVLERFAEKAVLGPLVIVHCGNNGRLPDGFVEKVMNIAGPHRNVMFVTLKVPRGWQDTDNAEIARDVAAYKNARIFDWHTIGTLLKPQNAFFYHDAYHLTPVGRVYYVQQLYKALRIWHWV